MAWQNHLPIFDIGTCFRFLVKQWNESPAPFQSDYVWYEMGFAYHRTSSGTMMVLCLDVPIVMQSALRHLITSWREAPSATVVHYCIVGEVVQLYDRSVWKLRDIIRGFEKVMAVRPKAPMQSLTWRL